MLKDLETFDAELGEDPALFQSRLRAGAGGQRIGLSVFDADGRLLTRVPTERVNAIADDPDFKALAAGEAVRISPMIPASRAGIPLFAAARRLERNGVFAGAAVAYLPVSMLSEYWRTIDLGRDSTVTLLRDDGWLVARFPAPEAASNLSGLPMFADQLGASTSGIYVSPASPIDDVARTAAFQRLDGLPLIAFASVAESVLAEARGRRLRDSLLVVVPFGLALLGVCGWMLVLLRHEERSSLALRAALDQNRVLMQEIHHRVKNNLHAVSSLVRLQKLPGEVRDDLTRRIAAMSAVHQHMYEADRFASIDARDYLGRVLSGLSASAPTNVRLESDIHPAPLNPDDAQPLGLLVNECVTNAFKHAFPGGRPGVVKVSLAPVEDGLHLTVVDDGVGEAAGDDAHEDAAEGRGEGKSEGLGRRLIRGFAAQLRGEVSSTSGDGFSVSVRFKTRDPGEIGADPEAPPD
ncbi:MAG: histidine kinase dimerization/phosphoacceptor domain -containing protein [Hyphomonadaceae bacterium]